VIPEGFAFGLPVLGSATGAIPEVAGDAGLIVPPGDFGALAGALLTMADPDKRAALSERARARAALYTVEAFAERVRDALMRGIEHRRHV
jgi:glycosyltransferase involved in cell wall biosynthesis